MRIASGWAKPVGLVGAGLVGGVVLTTLDSPDQKPQTVQHAQNAKDQKARQDLVKSMQKQVGDLRRELLDQKNDNVLTHKQRMEALRKLADMEGSLTKITRRLDLEEGKNAKLLLETKLLETKYKASLDSIQEAHRQLTAVQRQLSKANARAKGLEKQFAGSRKDNAKLSKQLSDANATAKGLGKQLAGAREQLIDEKAKNEKLTAQSEMWDDPINRILGNAAIILEHVAGETNPRVLTLRASRKLVQPAMNNTVAIKIPRRFRFGRDTAGSGTIVKVPGYGKRFLLTNYHVIRNKTEFSYQTRDKKNHVYDRDNYKGLYKVFPRQDLVILELPPEEKGLPEGMEIASSSLVLTEGMEGIAVGNPYGYTHSVSRGPISGLKREITMPDLAIGKVECVQHGAAINPGNEGGPFVIVEADEPVVAGINFAWREDAQDIAFMIPASTLRECFKDVGIDVLSPAERRQLADNVQDVTAGFFFPTPGTPLTPLGAAMVEAHQDALLQGAVHDTTRGLFFPGPYSHPVDLFSYPAVQEQLERGTLGAKVRRNERGNFVLRP